MGVQTYATWVHPHTAPQHVSAAPQSPDDLAGFIDTLIAQVPYYPSFIMQITSDAHGFLLREGQRVVQTEELCDGMVVLRTERSQVWITQADYQRLALA
jgi:hypothetical protein